MGSPSSTYGGRHDRDVKPLPGSRYKHHPTDDIVVGVLRRTNCMICKEEHT